MADSRSKQSIDTLRLHVKNFLAAHVKPGGRLAVAYSGGLDSSVLLDVVHTLSCTSPGLFCVSAVHVHHGLSPNADHWLEFCQQQCAVRGVPFLHALVNVRPQASEGIESAARNARHDFFASLDVEHVLMAHHRDDQAETLLLNLLRGCGVRGAAGMPNSGGIGMRYLRPFLDVPQCELSAYAKQRGLSWIEDESNADLRFSRNFIRREVMPLLSSRFPAAAEKLVQAIGHFAEAQALLDELAILDLQQAGTQEGFPLEITALRNLGDARALNLLRFALWQRGLQSPSQKQLQEALRQFSTAEVDRHPELRVSTYRLYRRKGRIELEVF